MKIQITIPPTSALVLGLAHSGPRLVECDPSQLTAEQRKSLSAGTSPPSRSITSDADLIWDDPAEPLAYTIEACLAARAERLAARATADAAERERQIQALLALGTWDGGSDVGWSYRDDPRVIAWAAARADAIEAARSEARAELLLVDTDACTEEQWIAARRRACRLLGYAGRQVSDYDARRCTVPVLPGIDAITASIEARCSGERARAEERRQSARAQQIADLVGASGTPDQIARHSEGRLPEDEVTVMIEAALLAHVDHLPRYERLLAADVPHDGHCDRDREPRYDTTDETPTAPVDLTASEYERLVALRALLRDGETHTVRLHEAWCDAPSSMCDAGRARRVGVRVRVVRGELSASRELALS